VDSSENPQMFCIYHPYGMLLLLGDHTNTGFIADMQDCFLNKETSRGKADWLQVYSLDSNC
jgi:hypothetical protein